MIGQRLFYAGDGLIAFGAGRPGKIEFVLMTADFADDVG